MDGSGLWQLRRRREAGSALFVALVMLVLMGTIGFASLDAVMADRQVAGFQTRTRVALDAAEAGLAQAVTTLRGDREDLQQGGLPAQQAYAPGLATTTLGDTASYPYGMPSFAEDPALSGGFRFQGTGGPCQDQIEDQANATSGTSWRQAIWEIQVQGRAPGNVVSGLQASVSTCLAYGYGNY